MNRLNSPLVDLTTINAIESIYRTGAQDPHKFSLAGQFGDLFTYADRVRYPYPTREDREPDTPNLIGTLQLRDSEIFEPVVYKTDEQVILSQEHLEPALQQFIHWSNANEKILRKTIQLHSQQWIRDGHDSRVRRKYVFDLKQIANRSEINLLARLLGCTTEMVFYTFDVALRYSLYGDLAAGKYYLAHPIRGAIKLPTQQESMEPLWQPCISFANDIQKIADRLSKDDFGAFLHELRGQVHTFSLHAMVPGEVDADVVREIASKLGLQSRFKNIAHLLGVSGGLLTGAAAIPNSTPEACVLGGAVTVAAAVWRGHAPRQFGTMRWLRWMVRFDVEDQVKRRS